MKALILCLVFSLFAHAAAGAVRDPRPGTNIPSRPMEWIRVAVDGGGFIESRTGKRFSPIGFNYDRDYKMRLLEDYWREEWETVEEDFREMKALGANVVRIHLQFGRFMDSPDVPNEGSLKQLKKLLTLAERTGLYLDLTGLGGYRKADTPPWFDALSETNRWEAQANFWKAIAKTCARSPAVFCYNLMNEPVVPGDKFKDWLVGEFGGFYYVQAIALDLNQRDRIELGRQWIAQMSAAVRKQDPKHLITIGLLPNSADEPSGSGFPPAKIVSDVDFISVHIYPRSNELEKDLANLRKFDVGKPIVIEEIFPIHCSLPELKKFIEESRSVAEGWVGFYWGQPPEELSSSTEFGPAVTREWLRLFQDLFDR